MFNRSRGYRRYAYSLVLMASGTGALQLPIAWADTTPDSEDLGEVVVTARRQSESALKVPESITVFDSSTLSKLDIRSFDDFATMVPNLSFAYGNGGGGNGASLGYGGARVIAIRGISGGGTTGFYLDDTPVPATIDPQVVDLQRIEVLKGPQGTLYGEGSMGGNVRLVTNEPSFTPELKVTASAGNTDHAATPDGRTVLVGNMPLIDDLVAVRAVGFIDHEGGFVTRQFPVGVGRYQSEDNQGATLQYGGSISFLVKAMDDLTILPRIMVQATGSHGLPSVFAPLPQFDVESFTLSQPTDIQEGYSDKWYLPSVELKYTIGGWDLVSSTSYFHRSLFNVEDGTEGTSEAMVALGVPTSVWSGGVAWPEFQNNSNVYQELRAAWAGNDFVHTIFGAYYSNEIQHWENGSPSFEFPKLVTDGLYPTSLYWDQPIDSGLLDRSLYGEAYFKASGFELTLGGRYYWLNETFFSSSNGFLAGGFLPGPIEHTSQDGFNPKATLSYTVPGGPLVYATAAKGFRAGGPNTPIESACDPGLAQLGVTAGQLTQYHSDSLWNYEVGAKGRVGGMSLTGALFEMKWSQIQQNLAIPVCFLPVISNAGAARIRGAELEASGRPFEGLEFRLGAGYQDPRITEAGLSPELPVGARVQNVPYFTVSANATYTHPLTTTIDGFLSTDYSYAGNSVSGTTTALFGAGPLTRAGYGIWNARIGSRWDTKQLSLYLRNITNSTANLGDINPIAFAPTNPTTGQPLPRVAVERPFQIGLEFSVSIGGSK